MRTRTLGVLALLAILAVGAGCSSAGSIEMEAVNDTALADRASRSLTELSPRPNAAERTPREIVQAAIESRSATVTAPSPPVDMDLPVAYDGAYYNLSATVVDRREAHAVTITVDYNTTDSNGTAIALEELPEADQAALAALFPQRVPQEEGEEFGVGAIYTDEELNSSVLAPVQQYDVVIVNGTRYAIEVGEVDPVTVATYRYTTRVVAESATAYAQQLETAYAFSLSNLSEEERSVLETAIEEGSYYAESTDDEAFESLYRTIRTYEAIVKDQASGLWLLRYEGELYIADLRYGGFLGEATQSGSD